ncbi:MAG: glycogen/starch synthase [Chlamydiia bacterium]|nr:glycogen/starch synthase [Chlamydiia bacterium]
MVKIVHVTAEIAPIAKEGGLADVVYGLSRASVDMGHQVTVMLPNYDCLRRDRLDQANFEGIELILIDDPAFERGKIWGCPDDVQRFSRFCQKAHEKLPECDVVHLHDWAACPFLFFPQEQKQILTIHNLAYQGIASWDDMQWLKPPQEAWQNPNACNLLQAGIALADSITTVSPTYAKEIQTEAFGCGLDSFLRLHPGKLTGILNGIDPTYWKPHKRLPFSRKEKPVIGCVSRLTEQKGLPLIRSTIDFALKHSCKFFLLGSSTETKINEEFQQLAEQYASHPDIHLIIAYDEERASQIYATSDLIIVPSNYEPCGLTQMIAHVNGVLPVVRHTGGLADTVQDEVDGFVFEEATITAYHATLDRALTIRSSQPEKWETMRKTALSRDWSWTRAAKQYLDLYSTPVQSKL